MLLGEDRNAVSEPRLPSVWLRIWAQGFHWLPAMAAAGLVAYATRLGPAVGSDGVEFIVSARNLAAGEGLGLATASGKFMILRLHPPLYPLLLAGSQALGVDAITVARWLDVGFYALAASLVARLIYAATKARMFSMLVGLLFAFCRPMVEAAASAASEPVFTMLALAAILIVHRPHASDRAGPRLGAAGLLGLAVLARYPGLAVAVAVAAFVGIARPGPAIRRIRDAVTFLIVTLLPVGLWLGYLRYGAGGATPRAFMTNAGNLWSALAPFRIAVVEQTWAWLIPGSMPFELPYRLKLAILGAGTAAVLVGLGLAARNQSRESHWSGSSPLRFLVLSLLVITAFLGLMAIAFGLGSPTPDLNERTLGPFLIGIAGLVLVALDYSLRRWLDGRRRGIVLSLIVAGLILVEAPPTLGAVEAQHDHGRGYTDERWQASGTIEGIATLNPSTPLISNDTSAILFLTGRPAFELPELEAHQRVADITAPFGSGASLADRMFRERGGALILFDSAIFQFESLYGADASRRLGGLTAGLSLYSDFWDGTIYRYSETGE